MPARPVDVAPTGPVRFPDSGLGRGWEAAAVIVLTALLLIFGLVSLYNASSIFAMEQELADTYYVLRQGTGVAIGVVDKVGASRRGSTFNCDLGANHLELNRFNRIQFSIGKLSLWMEMESSHIHSDCVCTNSKWVLHGRCWGQHVLCLLALVQRQFSSRGLRLLRKHGTSVCSRYSYNLPCLCSSLIYETRKSELPIKIFIFLFYGIFVF